MGACCTETWLPRDRVHILTPTPTTRRRGSAVCAITSTLGRRADTTPERRARPRTELDRRQRPGQPLHAPPSTNQPLPQQHPSHGRKHTTHANASRAAKSEGHGARRLCASRASRLRRRSIRSGQWGPAPTCACTHVLSTTRRTRGIHEESARGGRASVSKLRGGAVCRWRRSEEAGLDCQGVWACKFDVVGERL